MGLYNAPDQSLTSYRYFQTTGIDVHRNQTRSTGELTMRRSTPEPNSMSESFPIPTQEQVAHRDEHIASLEANSWISHCGVRGLIFTGQNIDAPRKKESVSEVSDRGDRSCLFEEDSRWDCRGDEEDGKEEMTFEEEKQNRVSEVVEEEEKRKEKEGKEKAKKEDEMKA